MIIPPQEENIKKLVDSFVHDFYLLNPNGTDKEEFLYVQNQVYNLPLVQLCPEMFMDVKHIQDYLRQD